jgi:hypothetical protein
MYTEQFTWEGKLFKFAVALLLLTSALCAQQTLRSVHKIFIDPMAHDLDKYIREEIPRQMKERVVIVVNKDDADAILTGVDEEEKGAGKKLTGRYLGLHDVATGTLSLLDKEGKVLLWSDDAGDQAVMFTALKKGGQRKVAKRLVGKFLKAMKKADYK